MKSSCLPLLSILLAGLLCGLVFAPSTRGDSQSSTLLPLLLKMESSYCMVNDYVAVLRKQERIGGRLLPEETILLKFQKPFKVYLRWIRNPHEGREALYVEGKYDNKLIGHQGGILGVVTLSLDPRGALAMRGNRHPITETGFGYLPEGLRKEIGAAGEHGDLEIVRIGEERFENRLCTVVEARSVSRGGRKHYASRMVLHIDKELMLPTGVAFYDDRDQLFERFIYTDVKLNPGLTAMDFSRYNSAYRF
jgi:hypothetical protein